MPFPLPPFSRDDFAAELATCSPEPLSARTVDALHAHYQELSLWNRRLSLIGPGTAGAAGDLVARHYGESLAALPLLPAEARTGLDLGSGAGFPGIVLAAARPGLAMTFVEAREKKWAFLLAAIRRASLPCTALNVRVGAPLPAGLPARLDLVTTRALKLDPEMLDALAERLSDHGCLLLWVGGEDPGIPPALAADGSVRLPGSERRRILRLRPRLDDRT
ncbi:MAG TPA: RsmG family class I SAM-dependent methyltransferase [Thermoanaerobaculia bacterium]|nr:RsmG family class I SAM-dependent methyltransferase [Thermoanaerobaculia bacterium]